MLIHTCMSGKRFTTCCLIQYDDDAPTYIVHVHVSHSTLAFQKRAGVSPPSGTTGTQLYMYMYILYEAFQKHYDQLGRVSVDSEFDCEWK